MVSAEVRARHPSVPRRAVPSGGLGRSRAAWAACALALLALSGSGAVLADPPTSDKKPKASSFAPHHANSRVYGSPVSKPILHKRKKAAPARPAPGPAEPIK